MIFQRMNKKYSNYILLKRISNRFCQKKEYYRSLFNYLNNAQLMYKNCFKVKITYSFLKKIAINFMNVFAELQNFHNNMKLKYEWLREE